MARPVRIASVEPLGGRALRLVFSDGVVRELDFDGVLNGTLSIIDDDTVFASVKVDPVAGTIAWQGNRSRSRRSVRK